MHGMLRAGRALTGRLLLAVSPGTLPWGIGNFPYRVCSACPTASSTPIALVRAGAGEGNELHAHAHEPADAPPGEGTTPACPHLIDIPVPRHLIESESQRTRVVHDEPSCRYPSTPTTFASKSQDRHIPADYANVLTVGRAWFSTAECGRENGVRSSERNRYLGGSLDRDLDASDGILFAGSQHHDPGWLALSIRILVRGPNGEEEAPESSVLLALHAADVARGGQINAAAEARNSGKMTGGDSQARGPVARVNGGRAEAKRFLFLLHVDSVWRLMAMENKFVSGMYVYTCYVLINPPMPLHYVLAAVFASCFYVLKSLLKE